jgi:Ca2+-binding RTX toxin-like protein
MTTIVGASNGGSNVFGSGDLENAATGSLGAHSATAFVFSNSEFQISGVGSSLSYSGSHPSGGAITSLTVSAFGFTSTWSGFSVSASTLWHDLSTGDAASFESLLFGGNDVFTSNSVGNGDEFAGYAGDDVFNMGANFRLSDQLDGGTGNDTVNLNGDYSAITQIAGGTLTNVETVAMAGGHSYNLELDDQNTLTGTLTFDASSLHATDQFTLNAYQTNTGTIVITGGAGNDTVRAGGSDITFNGGGGDDVISYEGASEDLTINLASTAPLKIGQGYGTDTLISVEGVTTGSGNDTITGDSRDNVIDPGSGNNIIDGGAGNDTLSYATTISSVTIDLSLNHQSITRSDGGVDQVTSVENFIGSTSQASTIIAGNNDNVINGGGFGGTLSYIHATSGVTIDFSAGTGIGNVTGGSGHDTISDIGNIIGSTFNDTLIVGLDPNNLSGGLLPQSFDGGGGDDTIDYSHLTSGINTNGGSTPRLTDVQNIIGTSFADSITAIGSGTVNAGDGNDVLGGFASGETLNGDGGDDLFQVALSDTTLSIDGGAGNDTVQMNVEMTNLATFTATTVQNVETILLSGFETIQLKMNDGNVAAGQTLTMTYVSTNPNDPFAIQIDASAETNGNYVFNTDSATDTLIGGAGNDTFNSGAGADTINIAFGGNDIVNAGADNDIIVAGAALTAADTINGGSGSDTLTLNGDYSAGLVLGATTLTSVETLQFAAGHSYTLTTNDANVAAGTTLVVDGSKLGAGDVLSFNGSHEKDGNFTLTGGAGNDLLAGGAGNDSFTGGGGIDTVDYSGATGAVTASLTTTAVQAIGGGEGSDKFSSIKALIGSAFNDALTAGGASVRLSGGNGNDVLNFGAILNTTQIADGGAGNDTLALNGNYAAGFAFGAGNFVSIETLQVSNGHSYNLIMNDANVAAGQILTVNGSALAAADVLTFDGSQETDGAFSVKGGHGNDVLAGGLGNDTLNGGAGYDTASYANAAAAVTVSLALTTAQDTGGAGSDTLVAIENLTGSAFADTLAGSSSANVLSGGAGNDMLDLSAGGNDTAQGGDGDDTIVFGASFTANDKIDGGAGNDVVILDGDYSANAIFRSTTLVNVETLSLTAGHNYRFTTNDGNVAAGATLTVDGSQLGATDTLTFAGNHERDGAFVLKGGAGADVLLGGFGNDSLIGGLGADHLEGGSGADHYIYSSVAESTGAGFDTITGFSGASDAFDLPGAVTGVDRTVKVGALSAATFDSDLTTAIGAGQLAAGHAVLFTASSGSYAHDTFLIVDANGVAGYQAGQDYVFLLDHPSHLSSLGTGSFI